LPDFTRIIRDGYVEILGRAADAEGLAHYNRLMNGELTEAQMREALLRSPEYAEKNPIRRIVRVNGRLLLVDNEPLKQFTLFAAGLRSDATLTQLFEQARALGYNCARVGSETADWDREDTPPTPGGRRDILDGLHGPEPGTSEQIENLNRVVRVAARERMALEVCVSFTMKGRPFARQMEHVRRTAAALKGEPHVFFTAINEPWVHTTLSVSQVNRLLRALLEEAPERLRGVDEEGDLAPEFRYDATICDFIAYHWPRGPGWEQAPGLAGTVARWSKPVLLNETQCYQSEAEVEEFGQHPLCQTNREGFVQLMESIYDKQGFGCYHSVWGIRSEAPGFAPDVRDLGRTEATESKLRFLRAT